MSENTSVGPAGANSPALTVTAHQTFAHLDDNADSWGDDGGKDNGEAAASSNVSISKVGQLTPVSGS